MVPYKKGEGIVKAYLKRQQLEELDAFEVSPRHQRRDEGSGLKVSGAALGACVMS